MKIGLGTVQFGVDYGVSNKDGKTPAGEVESILAVARELKVRVLDTASLYGDSEQVLGNCLPAAAGFDIVTKTPQFAKPVVDADDAERLQQAFHESLIKLKCDSLYGLLMHRADDLFVPGGERLMAALTGLKQQGLVAKIGVSVYSAEQIDQVLDRFAVDLVQLPISVLDQRLLRSGHLRKLKAAGVEVHARSVFLQGLLLMDLSEIPAYFAPVRNILESYRQFIRARGLTPLQAALGFVSGLSEIDRIICGVNNVQQLHDICNAANVELDCAEFADFAIGDEAIVNPALWRLEPGKP
ncbi:aryl-alcohol dehydrogenase [Methylomonas koyamae]|uniref:Aryl-alcohol dehydrogenase n=1 Tax=Methylomonas koyamae TaxID=702114 RepID=A0A177N775_9GAMM|nr:aldo/keto reductase [Methylomonas koyamae]OAI13876.1 aryl-alcohol dehydrogenase [Methylomonas koyamae]